MSESKNFQKAPKSYIGISKDHSGSMHSRVRQALQDFNQTISSIKKSSIENNLDTIMSVVSCGIKDHRGITGNWFDYENSNILSIKELDKYITNGTKTPLFDSIDLMIDSFLNVPDYHNENVTFLVMAISDGYDNASRISGEELGRKIIKLQNTDRWTFVFRVPTGNKKSLVQLGIPEGNILEWDTSSSDGLLRTSEITTSAIGTYHRNLSKGKTSTRSFYADTQNVSSAKLKRELTDISSQVSVFDVYPEDANSQIRDFIEKRIQGKMLKGGAFYELVKTEPKVQSYKQIIIMDRANKRMYSGDEARYLIGVPTDQDIRLKPGSFNKFDVFIQSTSVNRKVTDGSRVIYWPKVGVPFTEGPSSH
jgi:hypothetical protein